MNIIETKLGNDGVEGGGDVAGGYLAAFGVQSLGFVVFVCGTLQRRDTGAAAAARMAMREMRGEGETTAEASASSMRKREHMLGPRTAKHVTLLPKDDTSPMGEISVLF